MKKMTWAAAELGIAVVENKKKNVKSFFFVTVPPIQIEYEVGR